MIGVFHVTDAAQQFAVNHLPMASTSSVYGGNQQTPFTQTDNIDMPLTIYVATKNAIEVVTGLSMMPMQKGDFVAT